jgi:hypothetical protein
LTCYRRKPAPARDLDHHRAAALAPEAPAAEFHDRDLAGWAHLFEDCGASLTVYVPAGTEVRADVGSGSVEAVGLTGPLHLAATSGMVTMAHVSGPLWAQATSGAITARTGVDSRLVTAAVTSGWLDLGFDSAPERLTVGVGSGDGQVTVPAGTQYRMTSSGGPGLLRTASGLANARSGRLILASVGAGSLRISYPGDAG